MPRLAGLFFLVAAVSCSAYGQANPPLLAQQPTLSATQIAFVFAGDLWTVPRAGGAATRLTTNAGVEADPHFSPDGESIAFTGQYDGNTDVFVVAATGGVPRRLTYHPAADIVRGWTPDGTRVLFSSSRTNFNFTEQLFTVAASGGPASKLPLPIAYEASYSPKQDSIAYVPLARAFQVWKRYRGGRATPVWIAHLASSKVEKVPRDGSNDYCPMWVGDKVYFLSDRNPGGKASLWVYDTKSKKVAQAAPNTGMDFKSASAGPGGIVIEQFGQLQLFDLKSGQLSPVRIQIEGDVSEVRSKLVDVGKRLTNAHISPTGARALFEARGEILTVPAEKGDARNLTESPAVMDRDPAWSPDGQWIAYFSDESGEYELQVKDSLGTQAPRKFRLEEKPTFYGSPRWSPDNKKIAYTDAHLNIWYLDLEQKQPVKVAKDRYQFPSGDRAPAWSPDSQWLAYTQRLPNYLGAVFLYSLADGKSTQLTDGMSDAQNPVFDKGGKYLYFSASTDSGPTLEPDVHSIGTSQTRSLYLAVLSKADPSPFAPESDEEKAPEKKAEGEKPPPKPEEAKPASPAKPEPPKPVVVKIDFDKIGQRILAVPMPPAEYFRLQVGKEGNLFAQASVARGAGGPPGFAVHRYDLKLRKSDVVASGVRFFEASANGEKMLTATGDNWTIQAFKPMPPNGAPAAPPPSGPPAAAMKTEGLQVKSDPKAEWMQMYRDAWRIQREFFYDPNLHGVNVADYSKKYEKYAAAAMSRRDLNYVLADMMGELTVGHLFVAGGEQPEVKTVPTGLLGCDYKIENGRYRFERILDGENWNPDVKAPLTQPGVNVQEGEYLLAVNGRDVVAAEDVYSYFEATAGKQTVLRVGPNPNNEGSREVVVTPIPNESRLRNLAWVESNRRKVDQMTNGRVAYVYMPDTANGGLANFTRYFYAQVGKDAAIIDERFNGGGLLATDIIEVLNRKRMSAVATRDGEDEVQPQGAIFGPKVMIINEYAGSGGDAMPNYFRRANTGKLVGKRTWGGLVGRAGAPSLLDGGFVSAPSSGVWGPNSQWDTENIGVPPDAEVENDPELIRQGKDPQLEKAVELVLADLEKAPVAKPKRPAYPNYHKP
ncbi:S41 family peptidase [Paludibaculum fermentans]|uniref:Tricorn protease homolog n=1 Tax=Paludibaculum fermentans TaxID=1473598 RepID=A0A7S7SMX2_PALFE|nr:S41 family peptidase [Paludibaculum fermentans]QOY90864.1 PD40 domain-containing protein [Paludibaculum fermentans]